MEGLLWEITGVTSYRFTVVMGIKAVDEEIVEINLKI